MVWLAEINQINELFWEHLRWIGILGILRKILNQCCKETLFEKDTSIHLNKVSYSVKAKILLNSSKVIQDIGRERRWYYNFIYFLFLIIYFFLLLFITYFFFNLRFFGIIISKLYVTPKFRQKYALKRKSKNSIKCTNAKLCRTPKKKTT